MTLTLALKFGGCCGTYGRTISCTPRPVFTHPLFINADVILLMYKFCSFLSNRILCYIIQSPHSSKRDQKIHLMQAKASSHPILLPCFVSSIYPIACLFSSNASPIGPNSPSINAESPYVKVRSQNARPKSKVTMIKYPQEKFSKTRRG